MMMSVWVSSIGTRQCMALVRSSGMRSMFGKSSGGRISASGWSPP